MTHDEEDPLEVTASVVVNSVAASKSQSNAGGDDVTYGLSGGKDSSGAGLGSTPAPALQTDLPSEKAIGNDSEKLSSKELTTPATPTTEQLSDIEEGERLPIASDQAEEKSAPAIGKVGGHKGIVNHGNIDMDSRKNLLICVASHQDDDISTLGGFTMGSKPPIVSAVAMDDHDISTLGNSMLAPFMQQTWNLDYINAINRGQQGSPWYANQVVPQHPLSTDDKNQHLTKISTDEESHDELEKAGSTGTTDSFNWHRCAYISFCIFGPLLLGGIIALPLLLTDMRQRDESNMDPKSERASFTLDASAPTPVPTDIFSTPSPVGVDTPAFLMTASPETAEPSSAQPIGVESNGSFTMVPSSLFTQVPLPPGGHSAVIDPVDNGNDSPRQPTARPTEAPVPRPTEASVPAPVPRPTEASGPAPVPRPTEASGPAPRPTQVSTPITRPTQAPITATRPTQAIRPEPTRSPAGTADGHNNGTSENVDGGGEPDVVNDSTKGSNSDEVLDSNTPSATTPPNIDDGRVDDGPVDTISPHVDDDDDRGSQVDSDSSKPSDLDDSVAGASPPRVDGDSAPTRSPTNGDSPIDIDPPKLDKDSTVTNPPIAENGSSPTRAPKVDGDPAPTRPPRVDDGPSPTNSPKVDDEPAPTRAPRVDDGPAPTRSPRVDNDLTPTRAPRVDNGPAPTNSPKVDNVPAPTNPPRIDNVPAPTNPSNDAVPDSDDDDDDDRRLRQWLTLRR